jgi:hypothetical protein
MFSVGFSTERIVMEVTKPPMDVLEWIYSLTKHVKIVPSTTTQQAAGQAGKPKSVYPVELHEEVVVLLRGEPFTLPIGTEIAVFRNLKRADDGKRWTYMSDEVLAAIWLKSGNRVVEQFTVRTTGRVARRKL